MIAIASVNRSLCRALSLAMAAVGLSFSAPAAAQGDLLIAPTRMVVNGNGSSQVILSNIGANPATYRITLELRRMQPDGDLTEIPEEQANPTERAALDMIRYSPRRITLAPNQPQAVRISVRPPEGLPEGEYRVHMSFRAVPDVVPVTAQPFATPTGLTINLTPIYGITIPLIVRQGQLEGGATISNPQVVRDGQNQTLRLDMKRTGSRSIFGEIRVLAPGNSEPIYLARGIAIYPELTARALTLPLSAEQAAKLKGPLRFEYRELPENGGQLITAIDAALK